MAEPVVRAVEVKSVITKTNIPVGDYAVNPYIGCTHACKYCYACFMKRFTGHAEPWGAFLDVKFWPEIKRPEKYAGKELFFGSVTDPYLPQEEEYRRTRALLEQLQGSGVRLSIQTKSDLVLRDLDLIRTFSGARVGFSINTLEENFKNDMDKAVSIARRLPGHEGAALTPDPHHLLHCPHFPGHYGCGGNRWPRKGAMQSDLAGKPQSARQLSRYHPGLRSEETARPGASL